ncbi:MAG: GIY-YIG nuclease family protein [Pseudomonadota bacterium]
MKKLDWFIYIICCTDKSLYTGITTDVKRRFQEHKNHRGAKYFYSHEPLAMVYIESIANRSLASKREYFIKKLSVIKKQQLISSKQNQLKLFI